MGSRTLRNMFRKRIAEFTSAGISPRKLGLMLGFHTTPGSGGRERAPRAAWLEVTKLQALAARQVAKELNLRSVWSWGWGVWSAGETDPDKPAAACVYLWARSAKLCDGPAAAGSSFNASLTQGQLVFPPGRTLHAPRQAGRFERDLRPHAGDRRRGRRVHRGLRAGDRRASTRRSRRKQVSAAEKAVVTGNFGSYAPLPRGARQGPREPERGARRDRRRAAPSPDRGAHARAEPDLRGRSGVLRLLPRDRGAAGRDEELRRPGSATAAAASRSRRTRRRSSSRFRRASG